MKLIEFRFIVHRKQQREKDAKAAAKRRLQLNQKAAKNSIINRLIPQMMWSRRTAFVTTAFSIMVGICAYYYKTQFISVTSGFS